MSYDPIIKQYSNVIKGLKIEECLADDLFDEMKVNNEIVKLDGCNRPVIKVEKEGRRFFTYYGVPKINELWPFLNALVRISFNTVHLQDDEMELAKKLKGNLKLFVTATCTHCPAVAELFYQISIINESVNLEIYDVDVYEEYIDKYHVLSTPKIVYNEKEFPSFPPLILLKMLAKSTQ
jgi:alkyl hydroperoxide reductase subunit AhpF